MSWETFGKIIPQIRNPISGFFLDGNLAVYVFFVLSGEALSSAYFSGGGRSAVVKLAIKRYSRLTIPIAAACLITYFLYKAGLTYNVAAGHVVDRPDWLGLALNPAPSLWNAITYVLLGVYTKIPPQNSIIPFLWTMNFEMVGSILVFLALLLFSYARHPWLLIAALFLITANSQSYRALSCFMAGLTFASLRWNGFFSAIQLNRFSLGASWLGLSTIAIVDGILHWKALYRDSTPFVAIILLFVVFCNRHLCSGFKANVSLVLGKLSFPLYLMQFPILVSVTSFLICYVHGKYALTPLWILAIVIVSIVTCVVAAYIFEPVEKLTRWTGNHIESFFLLDGTR